MAPQWLASHATVVIVSGCRPTGVSRRCPVSGCTIDDLMITKALVALMLSACSIAIAEPCKPYQMSETEASDLLLSLDVIAEARERGGTPGPISYIPGNNSHPRTDRFYFFVIYAGGGADNGLLGYYAVDKVTGRVIDDVLLQDVTGKSLVEAQERLRTKHCVTAKMVDGAEAIDPFG